MEKNAIKNFPSNMGHRRAVRLFLRASIHRFERIAKGRPPRRAGRIGGCIRTVRRPQFMLYAWNLGCPNDGTEFHNFIFF